MNLILEKLDFLLKTSKENSPWQNIGRVGTFVGAAGSGKTFIICAWALAQIIKKNNVCLCGLSDPGMWHALTVLTDINNGINLHHDGTSNEWKNRLNPTDQFKTELPILSLIGEFDWTQSKQSLLDVANSLLNTQTDKKWNFVFFDCADNCDLRRAEIARIVLNAGGNVIWMSNKINNPGGIFKEILTINNERFWSAIFAQVPSDLDNLICSRNLSSSEIKFPLPKGSFILSQDDYSQQVFPVDLVDGYSIWKTQIKSILKYRSEFSKVNMEPLYPKWKNK